MAYQKRWRDVGACVRCGKPTPINKRTGKPFQECFKHRLKAARNQAKHYDRNSDRLKAYQKRRRHENLCSQRSNGAEGRK